MSKPVPALIVIDAQQGLLEGEQSIPHSTAIIDRISTLLDAARTAGALIIHLQNDGQPGTIDELETSGWFIHPKLSPTHDELVIRKTGDDGFAGTNLMEALKTNNIDRITIAGFLSEMCVSATARGALSRNLEVVLVRGAHATYHLEDISAHIVSRVAEHALGDEVEVADMSSISFTQAMG